jgi:hypothetical protein
MSSMRLKELLQRRREADRSPTRDVDWPSRRDAWLERLRGLFADIKTWLEPLRKEGLVDFSDSEVVIAEEWIGTYQAPQLEIQSVGDRVRLAPVGTLIVGGLGRIDMRGPKNRTLMLILSESGHPAEIRVSIVTNPDELAATGDEEEKNILSSAERVKTKCRWYFLHPSDRQRMTEITSRTFESVLMEMLMP